MTAASPTRTTFVDTNVLVYAHDTAEVDRQPVAKAVLAQLWQSRTGVLSTQVLTEFYSVATRKFDPPMTRREARSIIENYSAWRVVQVNLNLIMAASTLEEKHTLSFWDALIIEAARVAGAGQLVSEDLQDGHRIGGVLIKNPFATAKD